MELPITVVVPVGPNPVYRQWLPEALDSIKAQTKQPSEIYLLDDQAQFTSEEFTTLTGMTWGEYVPTGKRVTYKHERGLVRSPFTYYRAPWLMGVSTIFNIGVATAFNECVFMMGSDDKIMPTCLEECWNKYNELLQKDGWYHVTCQIQDGPIQAIPNHASMVTKGLWKLTGGFPPSAAVGGPDALLLSIMMVHMPDRIIQVKEGEPLYWVRMHEHQMTHHDAAFFNTEMNSIRNRETARWTPPTWTGVA